MSIVFCIIYIAVFTGCLFRFAQSKHNPLSGKETFILLLAKCMAGFVFQLILSKLYPGQVDAEQYNKYISEEYHLLRYNPAEFFTNIFQSNYAAYGSFFGNQFSYWNDLRINLILKLLAPFNILSGGNMAINTIIFSAIGFAGNLALIYIFYSIYQKKWAVLAGCFLLPSLVAYTSVIGKDGIVFASLAIFCYCIFFGVRLGFTPRFIILALLSFCLLLFIRNFVAMLFLPACIAWVVSEKRKIHPYKVFSLIYILGAALVLMVQIFVPVANPLKIVKEKQEAFFKLDSSNSRMSTDTVRPTMKSVVQHIPQAFAHSTMRPYFWESNLNSSRIASLELMLYWGVFLLYLIIGKKSGRPDPFVVMGIFFALSSLIFIGIIVPYAGVIVRYRSIFLPFIITPMLASLPPIWRKNTSY